MNKLEVGIYVRTSELYGGLISHITKVCEETKTVMLYGTGVTQYPFKEIIKSSHNIIDLIEVGDYVNGHEVDYKFEYSLRFQSGQDYWYMKNEDIKSIVTKEQFSSMKYRLGE
jgi:hypothetical protein